MLEKQSLSLLLRSLCFAGAAAAVTACGGGTSGSTLPSTGTTPTAGNTANVDSSTNVASSTNSGATTFATTASGAPSVSQWTNGSAFAPSSITVKFASNPAAGHLLVVALWNNGQSTGSANTYTAPSGWTLVNQNVAHSYHTYQVFSHVVASGEANSYVFKPVSAQREHVWIAADTTAASVDKSGNNYTTTTAYTAPSLAPSQINELALALNLPDSTGTLTWSNPSGWTVGNGPTSEWRGEALTSSLSTTSSVSESATLSASSAGFAGLVLLSPSQSGATPAPTATPTGAPTPAPTATPIVSAGTYTYHGCPVFTADDWFTTNLVSGGSSYVPNTVDPNSANMLNNINANVGNINFDGNVVPSNDAVNIDTESNGYFMTPIVHDSTWYGFANDPSNDDPSPNMMPVTNGTYYQEGSDMCLQAGGDCHVQVLDTVKCVDYEGYGKHSSTQPALWANGKFVERGGGVENLRHPYQIENLHSTSASIPMMGTYDWGEDETTYNQSSCRSTNSCVIPHTVQFVLPHAGQATGGYVAPAAGSQQSCTSYCTYNGVTAYLPEGARLRLKATYTCPSAASYPQSNMLCNQLKQYGMILTDYTGGTNSGGIRLGLSSTGSNPWNKSDYGVFLNSVHITNFEVMKLGTIHP
jgi:hypothetical protein